MPVKKVKKTSKLSKEKLLKELLEDNTKKDLAKLTKLHPNDSLKIIKDKLNKMSLEELKSLTKKPEPVKLSFSLNLIPIIILFALIGLSIATMGFTYWGEPVSSPSNDVINEQPLATINASVTYLTDLLCNDCYDVTVNSLILANYGLILTEEVVDTNSADGISLINQYNITKYPTFILSKEASNSSTLVAVWAQVGTIESDGSMVFRTPQIFRDTYFNKVGGEFVKTDAGVINVSLDDDPSIGNDSAPVIMVLFSEFQCPYSARFNGWVYDDLGNWVYNETLDSFKQIKDEYIDAGLLKFVFRDFPLDGHALAHSLSEAAQCAFEQGKYWEYHDALFENQPLLSESLLKQLAVNLGLNSTQFNDCYESGKYYDEVQNDLLEGLEYGVGGTPFFYINGREVIGALPYSDFKLLIDSELN